MNYPFKSFLKSYWNDGYILQFDGTPCEFRKKLEEYVSVNPIQDFFSSKLRITTLETDQFILTKQFVKLSFDDQYWQNWCQFYASLDTQETDRAAISLTFQVSSSISVFYGSALFVGLFIMGIAILFTIGGPLSISQGIELFMSGFIFEIVPLIAVIAITISKNNIMTDFIKAFNLKKPVPGK